MKILHIDETFHPLYGYHTTPLSKFQSMQGNEIYIITVESDKLYPVYQSFGDENKDIMKYDEDFEKRYKVKIIRVPVYTYISNRAIYNVSKVIDAIKNIQPDIIYCHLIESYISIMLILKNLKFPLIFDSHMLTMGSKNRLAAIYKWLYQKLITKKINNRKYIVIRTQDDNYINSHLKIDRLQTPFISFGTDTNLFKPDTKGRGNFRNKYNIREDDFVIIYTGKLTEDKGATFFANVMKKKFNFTTRNIVFIIVGNCVGEYGNLLEDIYQKSENRILRFPIVQYQELPEYYQAADLSVFPKQCSLSFFDAQACGLPVLSEDNNINVERLKFNNGLTFKSNDIEKCREKIIEFANMSEESLFNMRNAAIQNINNNYSYSIITSKYSDLMEKSINEYKLRNG